MRYVLYLIVLVVGFAYVWIAFVEPGNVLNNASLTCLEQMKVSAGDKEAEARADKTCRVANEVRSKFP